MIFLAALLVLTTYYTSDYPWNEISEEAQSNHLEPEILYGPYEVSKVVDGDTIYVLIGNEQIKVRLIGVDAPESVHPDKAKNSTEGRIVSDWMKKLLTDENVYLEYDVGQTDQYGRWLAYVYLSDKKTMVNELLLQNGYATILTIQPNVKYADDFYKIQRNAIEDGKGFWGDN